MNPVFMMYNMIMLIKESVLGDNDMRKKLPLVSPIQFECGNTLEKDRPNRSIFEDRGDKVTMKSKVAAAYSHTKRQVRDPQRDDMNLGI